MLKVIENMMIKIIFIHIDDYFLQKNFYKIMKHLINLALIMTLLFSCKNNETKQNFLIL